jgi:predicted RNase H-like HicB family nuclease
MKKLPFTVYIEQDEDGMFIGSIPSLQSCYAEGRTQEEMLKNLRQVLKLCLRNFPAKQAEKVKFVGIQNLEINYA